ncbi:MAG: nitrophenyl compound nitroreductase subunit ArsF family protein [Candidatus Pacebacteria bacterium]|nr:nitrophenyl compound nitroreductase subunit ArsF family protein [Candidatus Paceibacterota bacterium]
MKKPIIVILIIAVAVGLSAFIFKSNDQPSTAQISNNLVSENKKNEEKQSAGKIEVVHFHGTHQCWSCITVGEYALKTIKEKFPEEYKNGTIVFRNINGELLENKDMVMKYQARGSSLFVNAITDGKDKIEEDVTVWRLVTNENQFISYFENKLNKLLGR